MVLSRAIRTTYALYWKKRTKFALCGLNDPVPSKLDKILFRTLGRNFVKLKNEIEAMSPSLISSYMLRSLVNYPFGAIFQYNFVWKGEFQSTFLCHDCMKTTTHYFVHKSIELSPCVGLTSNVTITLILEMNLTLDLRQI